MRRSTDRNKAMFKLWGKCGQTAEIGGECNKATPSWFSFQSHLAGSESFWPGAGQNTKQCSDSTENNHAGCSPQGEPSSVAVVEKAGFAFAEAEQDTVHLLRMTAAAVRYQTSN